MATRKDVAELAGVSPGVVSYVINDSNYVSKENREKVLKAIKELNYTPNSIARSLKTNKSKHFALIGNDLRNGYFSELGHYMGRRAYEKGYIVSIMDMVEKSDYIDTLLSHQLAGICIASDLFYEDRINSIAEKVPLVLMTNRELKNLSEKVIQIRVDIYPAIVKAINYLYHSGKEKIAYLAAPPMDDIHKKNLRYLAYKDAMVNLVPTGFQEIVVDNLRDRRHEIPYIVESLVEEHGVNGFFCTNDEIACHVVKVLNNKKIDIPGSVGIMGCDDLQLSEFLSPAISSISYSKKNLGNMIVDLLIKAGDGEYMPEASIPTKLVLRESV